jgi:hypothetical protein
MAESPPFIGLGAAYPSNRMKILKKPLPSERLSTTLARLDRLNWFDEIR